jgi:hypothetical protein
MAAESIIVVDRPYPIQATIALHERQVLRPLGQIATVKLIGKMRLMNLNMKNLGINNSHGH